MSDAVAMERLFPVHQEQLTSDDYYTPSWVFERMGIEFDLDVCSPPRGVPWIPATRFLTMADDGLTAPWEGRVWMNPPFSHCAPWVRRFIEHRNGVCLVQVSKTQHSADLWAEADAIAFVGALMFYEPDFYVRTHNGGPGAVYMPVWLAAFGEECVEAIGRLGVVRRVLPTLTPQHAAVIDAAIALIERASETAGCDVTQRDLLPLARSVGILRKVAP